MSTHKRHRNTATKGPRTDIIVKHHKTSAKRLAISTANKRTRFDKFCIIIMKNIAQPFQRYCKSFNCTWIKHRRGCKMNNLVPNSLLKRRIAHYAQDSLAESNNKSLDTFVKPIGKQQFCHRNSDWVQFAPINRSHLQCLDALLEWTRLLFTDSWKTSSGACPFVQYELPLLACPFVQYERSCNTSFHSTSESRWRYFTERTQCQILISLYFILWIVSIQVTFRRVLCALYAFIKYYS